MKSLHGLQRGGFALYPLPVKALFLMKEGQSKQTFYLQKFRYTIPDDHITPHRPTIFMARSILCKVRDAEERVEWLMTQTIQCGKKSGVIDRDSIKRVAVDTTVIERDNACPTDSHLYERAREKLMMLAQEPRVDLRQTHARLAPCVALKVCCYPHAKHFKRMRKTLKKIKGYTGGVMRDLRRRLDDIPEGGLRDRVIAEPAFLS